jgi:hypothetical protein
MKLGRLDVTIEGTRLTLAGRIDDSSAIGELAAQLPPGPVTIDTAGVTFVNSIGMRELIRLVRGVRDRGPVLLERVADVLITQINMIPDLAGSVRIASFHAQYVCPACGAEAAPLVDAVAHAAELAQLRAPRLPCPECAAAMELGDFPERYLSVFRAK